MIFSITSPAISLDMLVLFGIPMELDEVLSWILKIQPWSLWPNIKAASWVGSPAISHTVVEVVRIGVSVVLVAIQTEIVSV